MSDIHKPSNTEDEYFVKEDAEKKRRIAQQVKKETAVEEQKRLKDLHFMHCPKCGMDMHEVKYGALDVDVCFACGGVFLDKGELEQVAHATTGKGFMSAVLNWFKEETKHPV